MPNEWSEGILLSELSDEPELSEELSAVFARLKDDGMGNAPPPQGSGGGTARAATVPHVVLNFGSVSYLNSSHIAALLRMRKRVSQAGKTLVLCSLSEELWSMMLLTGLDKVFQFAPDTMTGLARAQISQEQAAGGHG